MGKDPKMGKTPETQSPAPPASSKPKEKAVAPPDKAKNPPASSSPPAPTPPPPNSKPPKGKNVEPTKIEIPQVTPPPPGHVQKMKLGDRVVEMDDSATFVQIPEATPVKMADCYCEPNQWCCFGRCMKLGNMVGFVGFFDAGLYMMLSCVCGFVLLMWESTGKYVEARGFTTKYEWWEKFMIPNEDGIYLLLAAYVVSAISGWNLGLRFKNMKRCPPVWWLMCNIYTTGLQIVSMIFFPFRANLYNIIPIGIRVYQYWIVWSWDMFLKYRNEKLDAGEPNPQLAMELKEDTGVNVIKPPHRHHHHRHP